MTIYKGPTSELIRGKTVVVFHKAPPFSTFQDGQEVKGSLAIFEAPGLQSDVQFWMHKEEDGSNPFEVSCTLCTTDAEYEILGEL